MDARYLQTSRLLASLPPDALRAVAAVARPRNVAADTALLQEGTPADVVFFVLAGSLEITWRNAEDGLEYRQGEARAGDDLGLIEALAGGAYTTSARALTAVNSAVVPARAILEICATVPGVAVALLRVVATQAGVDRASRGSPVVDLARVRLDERLWELMPRQVMVRSRALPLAVHGGVVVVGFVDPDNAAAREEVQRAMPGLRIRAVTLDAPGFEQLFRTRVLSAGERRVAVTDDARWYAPVKNKTYDLRFIEGPVVGVEDKSAQVPGDVIVALVNRLIGEALDLNASDIHIEPTEVELLVRFRVDGQLRRRPEPIERRFAAPLVSRLKVLARMDIAERRRAQDGRIALSHQSRRIDFRLATVPTRFGERIVLRILDPSSILIDLEKLVPLPAVCAALTTMLERPQGMVIVAGPTGSGKTTTIYSALLHLRKADINILTIEDPIEYGVEGISQVQVNDSAGVTFATAVRNFLRQDPDVIMVGETRDPPTAATSVEAALTGHLVITSLHTNDAIGAIVRLREMGIEPFLLAHTVVGVISQRLVRRICPHCRERATYHRDLVTPLGLFDADDTVGSYTFFRGRGCVHCNHVGFRGRAAAFEALTLDDDLRVGVATGVSAIELERAALEAGLLLPLRDYCRHLITNGVTTPEEVARILFVERGV